MRGQLCPWREQHRVLRGGSEAGLARQSREGMIAEGGSWCSPSYRGMKHQSLSRPTLKFEETSEPTGKTVNSGHSQALPEHSNLRRGGGALGKE